MRARYLKIPDLNNINMSPTDFGDALAGKDIFSSAAVMQAVGLNYSRENANPELLNGAKVSSGILRYIRREALAGSRVHSGGRPARR